jgi:outer membrane protein assembly factor BamB
MYREPPESPPVVVTSDKLVQAFDSATGKPLWEVELESGGYPRLASTGAVLVVAVANLAKVIDLFTGKVLYELSLAFSVAAAVAEGGRVVLAGDRGLVCLAASGLVWGIGSVESETSFFGTRDVAFGVHDGQGRPVARLARFAGERVSRSDYGLCLGTNVAQPDVNT